MVEQLGADTPNSNSRTRAHRNIMRRQQQLLSRHRKRATRADLRLTEREITLEHRANVTTPCNIMADKGTWEVLRLPQHRAHVRGSVRVVVPLLAAAP